MARVLSRIKSSMPSCNVSRLFSSQTYIKHENQHLSDDFNKLSTLFVPGRHGASTYQIVKPLIDIDYITCNLGNLKLSCDHRGINLDLDFLLRTAKEWLNLRDNYLNIVEKEQKCISDLHYLNSVGLKHEMEDSEKKRKEAVDTLIAEKSKLHDIEDIVMPLFQKIPHVLHTDTPLQFSIIDICQEPPTFEFEIKSHVEIAKQHSLLHFMSTSNTSYFMAGKLSHLDLAIQMYFMDKLHNCGFSLLSGADFCKSFIIEAIGYDPYSNLDSILLKEKRNHEVGQKLHLVGGASFEAFCGYFVNMNINKTTMPLNYFSVGRRYNAANKTSNSQDLFTVVQSTNIHGLIISDSNTFDTLLQAVIDCYYELGIPFRMVNIAAKNLTVAESHRKQLELWSPALKDYIPVAYVSQHDDFVSKRLQITYGFQYTKEGYCHIVEGVLVNIPILIGCIVENLQTKDSNFNIPDVLLNYISLITE